MLVLRNCTVMSLVFGAYALDKVKSSLTSLVAVLLEFPERILLD